MSYDIIQGIKVNEKAGTVTIKAASSNVSPQTFNWFESPSLSMILRDQGRIALDKVMLREFWGGNFQRGGSLYDRTIKYYKSRIPMEWGNVGDEVGKVYHDTKILFTDEQLTDKLYECYLAFKKRDTTKEWIIKTKDPFKIGGDYLLKRSTRHIWMTTHAKIAKTFKSKEDAWLYYSSGDIVEKSKHI